MAHSIADSTYKQYNSALKFECDFSFKFNIDPYNPTEVDILDCLTVKFKEGAAYGTIYSFRVRIALVSDNKYFDSILLHLIVKWVYRLRPTAPRYEST